MLRKKYIMNDVGGDSEASIMIVKENDVVSKIVNFISIFQKLLKNEIFKIDFFFHYKLLDQLHRFEFLMINAAFIHKSALDVGSNDRKKVAHAKERLKNSFKVFYKESIMLDRFLMFNQEGI